MILHVAAGCLDIHKGRITRGSVDEGPETGLRAGTGSDWCGDLLHNESRDKELTWPVEWRDCGL